MEFKDVNERVEWEAKRVAAAFGVEKCTIAEDADFWSIGNWLYGSGVEHFEVQVRRKTGALSYFSVGEYDASLVRLYDMDDVNSGFWASVSETNGENVNEIMVRWLFRLGFEDAEVLSEFPPLSAHEKLELRLSLPRDFWPKTWVDEIGE